jgi:hypothetical protein
MLRIALHPRDNFTGVGDVRGAEGVVGNEVAVVGQEVHDYDLVIVQDVLDVGLQRVGHVAILGVWSNADGLAVYLAKADGVRFATRTEGQTRCIQTIPLGNEIVAA